MANLLDLIDGLNNSEKKQRQRQLDYWRDREETQKQHNITDLNEYNKELDKIYSAMITDCQNQINDWYMRYATKEGISIADAKKRVSTADQKYYAERAKEYVANKDFSDKANREMRLYNLTMKVNRMELLKANLGMAMTGGISDIEKLTGEFLDKKTLEELKRQAVILGKGVEDSEKRANDIVNASFKNATFSDRLWADMDSLRQSINVQVQRSLIRGLNPVEIARGFMPQLRNEARKARYVTERLARTEMSRVLTDAQRDSIKANGYDEYMVICERTACPLCRPFDGQHFPIDEMEVGYNASPFHPNCLCSQAPYMDREELEQSIREIEAERGDAVTDKAEEKIEQVKVPPAKPKQYKGNPNSEIAKECAKYNGDYYDDICNLVTECKSKNARKIWEKVEDKINVGSFTDKRGFCSHTSIHLNLAEDAKGSSYQTKYTVLFHESGHAIDRLYVGEACRSVGEAGKKMILTEDGKYLRTHFSSVYRDGLFQKTIIEETKELVKSIEKEIKADYEAHRSELEPSRATAYWVLEKRVQAEGIYNYTDLSDILQGATKSKVQCGVGHSKKYFSGQLYEANLATEAFAEMFSAKFTNEGSTATIKKYLPRSYEVFEEMLEYIAEHEIYDASAKVTLTL